MLFEDECHIVIGLCMLCLCYVMLCYVMLFEDECHIVIGLCMLCLCLCYVTLCYVKLCYVMLFEDECHIVIGLCMLCLCYVMLRYVMLCYVMLCYLKMSATLWSVCACYVYVYVTLCYVMLCYVIWRWVPHCDRFVHVMFILRYVMLCYVVLFEDECHIVIGLGIRELWVNESQVDITRFCNVNTFNQRYFSPACLEHRHFICLFLCCLFHDSVISSDSLSSTYWRINELWISINTEGSGRDFSCRTDAQILGTTKSLRLNFVRWRLICMYPW